jgi:predicted enzyme related to lactoylglutathione lyase
MLTPHGRFHWNELNTRDVENAKRFYADAIGWQFDAMPIPDGTYWIAKTDGQAVGGLFEMRGAHFDGVPDHWLPYLSVDDIDARLDKAVAAGAKVARPAFDVEGVGRIAIVQEPGGAMIGWMTPEPPR